MKTLTNTLNLRFANKGEVVPTWDYKKGNYQQFMIDNDIKESHVLGEIGKTGVKVHVFRAVYANINGENVIIGTVPVCGAQWTSSFRPLEFGSKEITCQKCLKRQNKH